MASEPEVNKRLDGADALFLVITRVFLPLLGEPEGGMLTCDPR